MGDAISYPAREKTIAPESFIWAHFNFSQAGDDLPTGQLPCIHKYCFTQRAQRSKARKEKYVTTQFRRERCEKSLIKRLNKDMCTG